MAKKRNINKDGTLKVYSFHPVTCEYVGEDIAFPNPLEKGQFLIPAGATEVQPPKAESNKFRKWNGSEWIFEDIVQPEVAPKFVETTEYKAAEARYHRNSLLSQSDWRMLLDIPEKHVTVWAIYRQALRDVPQQEGFPETIIWPTAPTI